MYSYSFKLLKCDLQDTIHHDLFIPVLGGKLIFEEQGLFNYEGDILNLE